MTLKLLFVIDGLGTGGAERSLAEALPRLRDNDIIPTIVCFHKRQEGVERSVLEQGYDVRFHTDQNLLQRVQRLRGIILREKPDLLHSTLFYANLTGRLASLGKSIPVLNSLVNTPYVSVRQLDSSLNGAKFKMVRAIDSWTARLRTDHFHAITHTVKEHAIEMMGIPRERITVVERGRDPSRLGFPSEKRRQRARMQLGLRDDAKVVVNVGRQEYQKGQVYLLQAFADLRRRDDSVILLIAGRRGAASAELDRLHVELGLQDKVRFLGFRDDIPEILAAADLFVFPSLFEGLGGALIEAMALGLPIVASDLPVLREVVEPGKNAVLVQPASPNALAIGIERLLWDPSIVNLFRQRSRAIFEDRFTLERSTAHMVDLYHKVAKIRR